jgi:hypothetical protein
MYHDMDFEAKPKLVVPFEHTFLRNVLSKKYQISKLLQHHLKQSQDKFEFKTRNIFKVKS